MKIAACVAASAAIFLSACASEPHPWKRPLSLDQASTIGDTNLALVENNNGVEGTWFVTDRSSIGAQYGLIGALVTSAMDGMANADPSETAQKYADEVATVALVDKINQGLGEEMKGVVASETYKIRFGNVASVQKIGGPKDAADDTIEFTVSYLLAQDASAIKVIGTATYNRADMKYVTPYTFKTVPEEELTGPLYRNSFIYESNRVTPPAPTADMKAAWANDVRMRYAKRYGVLPAKKSDRGYTAMQAELAEAANDTMTPEEAAGILGKAWTVDNGATIYRELKAAHAFLAKYLLQDLNSAAVPKLDGQDQIVEQLPDGRVVRIVGSGGGAGAYISTPGNLTAVATWGNGTQIAKVNRDRIEALEKAADAKAKGGK